MDQLVTVEQAAGALGLHVKTVLRYIREGRLPATRVGKGYRIARRELDAFAGTASGHDKPDARATCVAEVPDIGLDDAGRIARHMQAAALSGDAGTPRLHLETMYDPERRNLKVVIIGSPGDAAQLLQIIEMELQREMG